ncbi:MAG TPA: flagellar basal body P-ring formation chaperone FlgA [Sphingomonadaceae bacterium]|nr:flagellar basal body P-ring formation chaperone FlgA [Sphingomonadaceae bacterium]
MPVFSRFVYVTIGAATALAALPTLAAPPMTGVPVLNHTVERGERLSAADFSTEQRVAAAARGALDPAEAVGLEATRRLRAGSVVRATDLVHPQVVHRGEAVMIALRTGGLSITTTGRALSGGGVGDQVRVMSNATNHTLNATIEDAGRVRLLAR